MDYKFRKEERLVHRMAFENLLKNGTVYFSFPLRITWYFTEFKSQFPAQIGFAVPKKKFKRANKRNYIKRRLREAYRLNKNLFYTTLSHNNLKLQALVVFVGTELTPYKEIELKLNGFIKFIISEAELANKKLNSDY